MAPSPHQNNIMAFVRGVIYDQLVRRLLHKLLPRRPVWSPAARSLVTSSSQHRICSAPIPEFEDEPGIKSYDDLYRFSLENPDTFWSRLAKSRLRWYQEFDKVSDCDVNKGKIAWFLNGKLNVSGIPFVLWATFYVVNLVIPMSWLCSMLCQAEGQARPRGCSSLAVSFLSVMSCVPDRKNLPWINHSVALHSKRIRCVLDIVIKQWFTHTIS